MKYILILTIVLFGTNGFSQDYKFSTGLTFQPCFYKNYNKNDWNNMPQSYPDNPRSFNGVAFGVTFGKSINENFNIGAELLFSNQTQHHKASTGTRSDGMGNILKYFYNLDLSRNFKMLSLPIHVKYSHEVGFNSGLYVSGYAGIQLSYLLDYKDEYYAHRGDFITNSIDTIDNTIIRTPNHVYQKIWRNDFTPPQWKITNKESDYFYNRFLIGMVSGVEISKRLFYNYMISIGFRYEFDFTNSEKSADYVFTQLGNLDRPKTHNIRYGLSLSVVHLFK